jgi:hypothetical protein
MGTVRVPRVKAGRVFKAETPVEIPPRKRLSSGDYYIGAIADTRDAVLEMDEDNNSKASRDKISIE